MSDRVRAYTVDRTRQLREGQLLDLQRHADVNPPELQIHADSLFPAGFSNHGERYFLQSGQDAHLAEPNIELIWEYVRRSFFAHRPSRFVSTFACRTLTEAREWRDKYRDPDDPIWTVECDGAFLADMGLLTQGNTILVISYLAHLYWRGLSHPKNESFWEYLLVPPISVLERVS